MESMKTRELKLIQDICLRFDQSIFKRVAVEGFLNNHQDNDSIQRFYRTSREVYLNGVMDGLIVFSDFLLEAQEGE